MQHRREGNHLPVFFFQGVFVRRHTQHTIERQATVSFVTEESITLIIKEGGGDLSDDVDVDPQRYAHRGDSLRCAHRGDIIPAMLSTHWG